MYAMRKQRVSMGVHKINFESWGCSCRCVFIWDCSTHYCCRSPHHPTTQRADTTAEWWLVFWQPYKITHKFFTTGLAISRGHTLVVLASHDHRKTQVQRGARSSEGIFSRATPTVGGKDAVHYRGMLDALRQIYRAGGWAGLFKGSGARMAFHAPSTAIAMATFERARDAWGSLLE